MHVLALVWPPVRPVPLPRGGRKGGAKKGQKNTVDQFIRHAESGLFGDEDEVDYPYVCDGDY